MQEHIAKKRIVAEVETSIRESSSHHARDLRTALAWLESQGDLITTDKTVDPDLQVTGLQKHMDGGCPVMFNNVKGKPHHRVITNLATPGGYRWGLPTKLAIIGQEAAEASQAESFRLR